MTCPARVLVLSHPVQLGVTALPTKATPLVRLGILFLVAMVTLQDPFNPGIEDRLSEGGTSSHDWDIDSLVLPIA